MNTIKFRLGGGSDPGCVRTNNEDNFVASADLSRDEWYLPQDQNSELELGEKGCLMVVADGMGGMNAGEVASDIAVKTVEEFFASGRITPEVIRSESSIAAFMKEAVATADKKIKERSRGDKTTEGMGTTVVMAWILGEKVYVAWCGDSRAYSFHPDAGLKQLSKDHSYVQELIDSGKLDPEYAFDHPDSNIITRSLGDPRQEAHADCISATLYDGETILLCSDGLSGMIRDQETEEIVRRNEDDMVRCKEALIEGARNAGGHDNITVMMCRIVSGAEELPVSLYRKNDTGNGAGAVPVEPVAQKSFIRRVGAGKLSVLVIILLLLAAAAGWYFGRKSAPDPVAQKPVVEQPEAVKQTGNENPGSEPGQAPLPEVAGDPAERPAGNGDAAASGNRRAAPDRPVPAGRRDSGNNRTPEPAAKAAEIPSEVRREVNPGQVADSPESALTPVLEGETPAGSPSELTPASGTVDADGDTPEVNTDKKDKTEEKVPEGHKTGVSSENKAAGKETGND